MPTLYTIGGYAFIGLVGVGYYYFVSGQRKQKHLRSIKQAAKSVEPKKDTKGKKGKKDGALSSDQDVKQGQKKKQPVKAAVEEPAASSTNSKVIERDEKDLDREFARQLSNAKRGIVDTPKSQASSRPKSIKQTRAQEKPVVESRSETGTAPSSTTGGDADDDESPINSPQLSATPIVSPAVNGDVTDMLEKPGDGPSVLKITAPTNNSQPKKAQQPQSAEVKETKKQRQNRKKAEEKKLAREEEEKARKVREERQRRAAREAEGRAAKDGSAFMASQAPTSSAWTASPAVQATNGNNTAPAKKVELLDTYEPTNGHVATKPVGEIYSESKGAGSKLAEELSKIPEDEQIRVATEDSGLWEQVKVKTSRKKKASKEVINDKKDNKSTKQESPSSADESSDFGVPPVIEPTGPGKKWQMDVTYVENGKVFEREDEVQDSEWEVA